ncbi:MAG TPA: hypothetical protein VGK20_03520 [Candidatus Binatia bacterium]|jgi:hypothetical protein
MKTSARLLLVAILSIALPAAASAAAIDPTGTYTLSKGTCKNYNPIDGNTTSDMNTAQTLSVTVSGSDLYIVFATVPMYGKLILDPNTPDSKGVSPLVNCTVTNNLDFAGNDYNYMGRLDFKSSGTTVKLKGRFYTEAANNAFNPFVSFCSFSAERTSSADPGNTPCP